MNRSGSYHAIDLVPMQHTTPAPAYYIMFVDVPPQYAFLFKKNPKFNTKDEAFTALRHYEFEYDAYGHVCSKFGLEPDPARIPAPITINPEEPQ
jgi:hypothetical protein